MTATSPSGSAWATGNRRAGHREKHRSHTWNSPTTSSRSVGLDERPGNTGSVAWPTAPHSGNTPLPSRSCHCPEASCPKYYENRTHRNSHPIWGTTGQAISHAPISMRTDSYHAVPSRQSAHPAIASTTPRGEHCITSHPAIDPTRQRMLALHHSDEISCAAVALNLTAERHPSRQR